MFNTKLTHAVENFAALILPLSEKDLEREWIWKDHDKEGIRFACFVTLQELRHLAVELSALRPRRTSAQHILSQYHAAYMDLQAAIFGLSEEYADKVPAEGEWQVRRVYAHILSAEINFTITVRYALEKHRASLWTPERVSDEDEYRLAGMSEGEFGCCSTVHSKECWLITVISIQLSLKSLARLQMKNLICPPHSGRRRVSPFNIDCIAMKHTIHNTQFKLTKPWLPSATSQLNRCA